MASHLLLLVKWIVVFAFVVEVGIAEVSVLGCEFGGGRLGIGFDNLCLNLQSPYALLFY